MVNTKLYNRPTLHDARCWKVERIAMKKKGELDRKPREPSLLIENLPWHPYLSPLFLFIHIELVDHINFGTKKIPIENRKILQSSCPADAYIIGLHPIMVIVSSSQYQTNLSLTMLISVRLTNVGSWGRKMIFCDIFQVGFNFHVSFT